jgi:hypothetical protein
LAARLASSQGGLVPLEGLKTIWRWPKKPTTTNQEGARTSGDTCKVVVVLGDRALRLRHHLDR